MLIQTYYFQGNVINAINIMSILYNFLITIINIGCIELLCVLLM